MTLIPDRLKATPAEAAATAAAMEHLMQEPTILPGTIRVLYSCHGCGKVDAPVDVLERQPGDTVGSWMLTVQAAIGAHHRAHAPECGSRVCDLKIPMTGRPTIGGPVHQ